MPPAIGSDPLDPKRDSREAWQICMRGHAAANFVPVVASNRIGTESSGNSSVTFYGSSFIAGSTGQILAEADRSAETAITAELNLDNIKAHRSAWGFFRDRSPEMYRALMTIDGDIDKKNISPNWYLIQFRLYGKSYATRPPLRYPF